MTRSHLQTPDLDQFVNDITIRIWNRLMSYPQFAHLRPQDFCVLQDNLKDALVRYSKKEGAQATAGLRAHRRKRAA